MVGLFVWITISAAMKQTKGQHRINTFINEKSKKMLESGPVCPPHNWGDKKIKKMINGFEREIETYFCDICKRTPSQINDS